MGGKKGYMVGITLTLIMSLIVGQGCLLSNPGQGEIFDHFEAVNGGMKIRVTARRVHEEYALPGAEYVIESARPGSDDFRKVMTLKADQAIPIPRRQVRFVSDQVGYIFMGTHYIVTTDGALTWTVWNSEGSLPGDQELMKHNISPSIKEVEIRPDGEGRMILIPYFEQRDKGPDLYTKDFGRHWSLEATPPPK